MSTATHPGRAQADPLERNLGFVGASLVRCKRKGGCVFFCGSRPPPGDETSVRGQTQQSMRHLGLPTCFSARYDPQPRKRVARYIRDVHESTPARDQASTPAEQKKSTPEESRNNHCCIPGSLLPPTIIASTPPPPPRHRHRDLRRAISIVTR